MDGTLEKSIEIHLSGKLEEEKGERNEEGHSEGHSEGHTPISIRNLPYNHQRCSYICIYCQIYTDNGFRLQVHNSNQNESPH